MRSKLFVGLLIVAVILGVPALRAAETAEEPDREVLPLTPGFYGYPLKYFQLLRPEFPFPKISGLYVTTVDRESPPALNGLRHGAIIQEIAGEKVNNMAQVETLLKKKRGREISFSGYEITPSYEKRKREDPFYQPRHRSPYRTFSLECKYPIKYVPEPSPVYVAPEGSLYHKQGYRHSPDTSTMRVIEGKQQAEETGDEPCPICFPGDEGGVTDLVSEELVGEQSSIVKKLRSKHGQLETLPADLEKWKEKIFKHKIRRDAEPDIVFLDTDKFCGLGLPGGEIVITRGLWKAMENSGEKAFLLAHLLGHFDFRQSPGIETQNRFMKLLRRAIKQAAGGEVDFSRLEQVADYLPSYATSTYRGLIERGYGSRGEKRALLGGMVYLYRAGLDLDSVDDYLELIRDLEDYPNPRWLDFELRHPLPDRIDSLIVTWKKLIPKKFDRET